MNDDLNKVEDNQNVISATSTGEVKKILEWRWLKTASFINIDDEEFEWMWDWTPYIVEAGETNTFPLPLTEHLAASLASKMLTKQWKIPNDNVPLYNQLIWQILGKEIVDYNTYSYKDLIEMATKKWLPITQSNGKPAKKEQLIESLSK